MATNHVKKGANRAGAMGKRAKAAQGKNMLPPRSEAAKAAREKAVADARAALAEHEARQAAAEKQVAAEAVFAPAYDFANLAAEGGWEATVVTGWLGSQRTATVAVTRGQERLVVSWLDGAINRAPLHTNAQGRNSRLAGLAAAKEALR